MKEEADWARRVKIGGLDSWKGRPDRGERKEGESQ